MAVVYGSAQQVLDNIRDLSAGKPVRQLQTATSYAQTHTYNTGDATTDGYLDELNQRVMELMKACHNAGLITGAQV